MSAANSPAPQMVGNYVIEHALAHGSMGTVYVARHSLTYARVALKLLRTEPNTDKQAEERFLREVRAAAQIGHDGIVKVQDAGKTPEGHLYLAMELLTGETLENRIASSNGQRLIGMDWLLAVLEPLTAAHENSIVHRDLKPANVFIARAADGSERVKLLDFGLARDTREKSGTQTGIALGTPYYMSPEQAARPKDVSPASDVWSMGVMMYEVLTGSMPFDGETLHAVVISAATMPHVPVRTRAPELHPQLAELVDECLSKRPELRPRDAAELRARLLPLLDDESVRADLANSAPREATSHEQGPGESMRMPFAETAIALAHDSRIEDVHPRIKKTGLGIWVSTFAVLALVIAGVFWALERNTSGAELTPPPRNSVVPASSRGQLPAKLDELPQPDPQAEEPPAPADPETTQAPASSGTRRGARSKGGRNTAPQAEAPQQQQPATAPQAPAAAAPSAQEPSPQAAPPAASSSDVPTGPEPAPETNLPPSAVEAPTSPPPEPEPEQSSEAPVTP